MSDVTENLNAYSMESLQWLIDAGADEAIGEFPINRFETSAKAQAIPQNKTTPNAVNISNTPTGTTADMSPVKISAIHKKPNVPQESLGAKQAIEKARAICAKLHTVDEITQVLQSFDGCPSLKNTASNTVVYRGADNPEILCIGNAPNRGDDSQGIPFSGNSKILLDRMFNAIEQKPVTMGYTNAVFWHPPGGRSLSPSEYAICRVFLDKIIEILSPKMIVIFGGETCKATLSTSGGIGKLHGKLQSFTTGNDHITPCIALHHPDYILQTPVSKPIVWEDLKILKQHLLTV